MNHTRFGGTDVVSVPRETYMRLQRESAQLMGLRACGVDNWEGYGDAMRLAMPSYGCDDYSDGDQLGLPL